MELIKEQIDKTRRLTEEASKVRINQVIHFENQLNFRLDTLEEILPRMEEKLKEQHLAIQSVDYRKTGKQDVWDRLDVLKVDLKLIPTSGKFKFINFNGYSPPGANRNREKLNEKVEYLTENLKVKGLPYITINPYSLEKNSGCNSIVLATLRI